MPSYFEYLTVMAFHVFLQEKVRTVYPYSHINSICMYVRMYVSVSVYHIPKVAHVHWCFCAVD